MDFISFLKDIEKLNNSVVSIYQPEIESSGNFLFQFYSYLKSRFSNIEFLNISDSAGRAPNLAQLRSKFEISFLGNNIIYCIKDFNILDINTKKSWQKYFAQYSGPHKIIFFDNTQNSKPTIELPELITQEVYNKLFKTFYSQATDSTFVKKLYNIQPKISLEQAFNIMRYQLALGKKSEEFFSDLFTKIIIPETSLFNLSQSLFAQDKKSFFSLWEQYKDIYPEEYWVIFWSEQLWQAINFIYKINNSNITEAKKAVTRLPFSFINKDWKRFNIKFLIAAHNQLYNVDFNLKNGFVAVYALESWYHNFLYNKF